MTISPPAGNLRLLGSTGSIGIPPTDSTWSLFSLGSMVGQLTPRVAENTKMAARTALITRFGGTPAPPAAGRDFTGKTELNVLDLDG